jgi:hypothetical protein
MQDDRTNQPHHSPPGTDSRVSSSLAQGERGLAGQAGDLAGAGRARDLTCGKEE